MTNSGGSATSLFDDITVNELDAETAAFGNTVIVSSNGISFNTNTAAATTRTNLGGTTVGNAVFTATNAAAAADAIGLGVSNYALFTATYLSDSLIINGTNPSAIAGTASARLDGAMGLQFLGSNAATLAATTRTNLGGTTVGNAVFTANGAATAANAIGLGEQNNVKFNALQFNDSGTQPTTYSELGLWSTANGYGGFYSYYD